MGLDSYNAFNQYLTYGGMPLAVLESNEQEKRNYLANLHKDVYIKDIVERYKLKDDVVVEVQRMVDGKRQQAQYEIDFIVNTGFEQIYIQSALNIDTPEKREQETFSLRNTRDSFRKIVVLDGFTLPWTDNDGVTYVGIIPFLLGEFKL